MIRILLGLVAVLYVSLTAQAEIHVQAVRTLIDDGTAQVRAGSYSYYDLTLTQGEELVVDMQVHGGLDNSLSIWLLDLANFQRFEAGQQFSYFKGGSSGEIRTSTSYRFNVPSDNIYYLIMDNRAALTGRDVRINASKIVSGETEESKRIHDVYSRLYYETLKKLFIFEDFDIYVQMCGTANAFSSPDIYMCRELIDVLLDQGRNEVIAFVFLHEAAHSLLNVWDYPLYDNEDAADELATALLLLADQKMAALGAAKWWADQGSRDEALAKIWVDDRHTVSPQRARNIINWVNNEEELTRRWLHLLIPKFTDEALEAAAADTEELNESHVLAAKHELLKRQALQAQN